LTLSIWVPPQFNPNLNNNASTLLKQRLASFEAEHPGIEIDVRIKSETGEADLLNSLSITSMAAPAALPDLIALPRPALETAAQKGLVRPLEGLSEELEGADWYPYARDLGKVEGTTFGIPFAGDGLVIMYRSDLVWIKTWDSILLSESQLIFAGADPQSQVGLSMYVSAGGELMDAQGNPTLDQEVLTRVLDVFARGRAATLFPDAAINIATEEQVMQEYRARRAEMAVAHFSQFRSSQDGLLQPLMGLDVEHLTFATGWVWSLAGQNSERQQLAVELAEYLTADEFLSRWIGQAGYLPTRPSVLDEADRETMTPIIDAAELVPPNEVLSVLGPIMQEALTRVISGEQSEVVARSVIEKLK
jgi:ABC-type glycerol-3-phosphate transport system substrate-binding protein